MERVKALAISDCGLRSPKKTAMFFVFSPGAFSNSCSSRLSDLKMSVPAGDLACSSACLRVLHGFELP
jgi:hypothetical protein